MADRDEANQGGNNLEDALTRLRSRLGRAQFAETEYSAEFGPDSHPFADLKRLALLWRQAGASEVAVPDDQPMPGPAAIVLMAEKLGLEVIWETMALHDLKAADLPAVVLLRNGSSRIVLMRDESDQFHLLDGDGSRCVPVSALARAGSGTVFRVRAIEKPAMASLATEPVEEVAVEAEAQPAAAAQPSGFMPHIRRALRGQRTRIVHLCLASLLINLLGMALPLFSMAVFDRVIPHNAMDTLIALALGVSVALIFEMALRHARLKLFDGVGLSAAFSLQSRLMGRLFFARSTEVPRSAGPVLPVVQELDAMAQIVPQLVVSALVDLPFFVALMIFIAAIAGPVVLAPLVGTLLLVGVHVLTHLLAKRAHKTFTEHSRRQMQVVIDSVAANERIRTTGAGHIMMGAWEKTADDVGFAAHEGRYWHGMASHAAAVLVQAVVVATVVIGVFRIESAAMTIGALSASILLVNRSMMPVSQLTGQAFRFLQGLETVSVATSFMNTGIEAGGDDRIRLAKDMRGQLDLHKITLVYPGESRHALKDVSFSIRPGEKIGLIGKAGCGKSSLLKAIVRLHDPVEGRMTLDGRDMRQFDPAEMRQAIALMAQDAQLLDLSLYDNMTIGLPAVDQETFERVAKISGVHDFASRHPSGYSFKAGPGGARLSGGERQAVALARALMGQPKLLLLDEPTAAFDHGQEARLINELKTALNGVGLILATHRLPVLALVDRIIWLDGGRVVADGPKDQIFAKFGLAA